MSVAVGVVKSNQVKPVKDLRTYATDRQSAENQHAAHINQLKSEISELQAKIVELETKHARETEEAIAKTKLETEKAIHLSHDRLLAVLKDNSSAALGQFAQKLSKVETLSITVTEAALANIFDDPAARKEALLAIISDKVRQIKQSSDVVLRVSQSDFATQAAANTAVETYASPISRVHVDPNLDSGQCTFEIDLGDLEIDLPDYWSRLKDHFAILANETLETP